MADDIQKRRFFRIVYPHSERPTLRVDRKNYEVLDVSEEGVCFALPPGHSFQAGERIIGNLDFCRRDNVDVRATILRVNLDSCVITLVHHIPLPLIMSEQRYLFANFHKKSS